MSIIAKILLSLTVKIAVQLLVGDKVILFIVMNKKKRPKKKRPKKKMKKKKMKKND